MSQLKKRLRKLIYGDVVTTSLYSLSRDFIDFFYLNLSGKTYLPSWFLRNSVGAADRFEVAGKEMSDLLIKLANAKRKKYILDVGCGCGRVALYLARSGFRGTYWGMDIYDKQITWAQKNISIKYPRFHFYQANLYNKLYNPRGKLRSRDYLFPFPDNSFDLIYFTSVFTHLVEDDMKQFIKETSRLLTMGGLSFMTFFLLNPTQERLKKDNLLKFKYGNNIFKATEKKLPEAAIAYNEKYVTRLLKISDLTVIKPILYGNWSGRGKYTSFQDIVLAVKN